MLLTNAALTSCSLWRGSTDRCAADEFAAPSVAVAAGLNHLALCDDFTSDASIDKDATLKPGYNWYTSIMRIDGAQKAHVTATEFTVSNSVLHLNAEEVSGGYALYSAALLTYSPNSYVGKTYVPPFYLEYRFAVNKSLAPGSLGIAGSTLRYSWPSVWLNDITLQFAQFSNGTIPHSYAEIDPLEFYVSTVGMGAGNWQQHSAIHIWDTPTTIDPDNDISVDWGTTWDDATYHVVGVLVNSTAVYIYFDGALMNIMTTTGGFAPAFDASYNLIINPGYQNWPIHVDYVQIWK